MISVCMTLTSCSQYSVVESQLSLFIQLSVQRCFDEKAKFSHVFSCVANCTQGRKEFMHDSHCFFLIHRGEIGNRKNEWIACMIVIVFSHLQRGNRKSKRRMDCMHDRHVFYSFAQWNLEICVCFFGR